MNVKGQFAGLLLAIACGFGVGVSTCTATDAPDDAAQGQPRLAFWIATSRNGIFDSQTLHFVADHADTVVLNAPVSGENSTLDYAQVVARLHALNSDLPILLYFWATRVYNAHKSIRSGGILSQRLADMPRLLLKNPISNKMMQTARLSYADVASPEYQQWIIGQVKDIVHTMGVNGVVSDNAERQAFPQWCGKKPDFCQQYAAGIDTLFADIKSAISPKLVMFNGLWANKPGRLARQEKLLKYTDGAAIEWFGRRQDKPIPPFRKGLLPYFKAIQSHPDKRFMVFARGATTYTSYSADYLWQRYLYAAYLMVARPNTSFRYLSTFQSVSPGRAYMFTLYDDVATKIGVPKGRYQLKDGMYARKFSNGLALFVPRGGEPATYTLAGTLYGPAGKSYSGKVHLKSGEGLVLFSKPPQPHPFKLSFTGAAQPFALPASHVVTPAEGTPFLRMDALPTKRAWEHDILLNPIKTLKPSLNITIRLRTKDPKAALRVVAEVDDSSHKAMQAVVSLKAGTCSSTKKNSVQRISFRWPYGRLGHPMGCSAYFLKADGKWHTYVIPVKGVLFSDFTIRRWGYVRFNGALDLQYISQSGSI